MKKTVALALACLALASCSKKHDAAPKAIDADASKGHFTIVRPNLPEDPAARKVEQERLVESMVDTPEIDLGTLQGEAYRRGVTLTPSQIARKKVSVTKKAPMQTSPGPAPTTPEAAPPVAGPAAAPVSASASH